MMNFAQTTTGVIVTVEFFFSVRRLRLAKKSSRINDFNDGSTAPDDMKVGHSRGKQLSAAWCCFLRPFLECVVTTNSTNGE